MEIFHRHQFSQAGIEHGNVDVIANAMVREVLTNDEESNRSLLREQR